MPPMSSVYTTETPSVFAHVDRFRLSLPIHFMNRSDRSKYRLDMWQEHDVEGLFKLYSRVIKDGQTFPQETTTIEEFRSFFLSHYCFVINHEGRVIAGFYIKPSFPGRSSHIANYDLLVHPEYTRAGLESFITSECIRMGRALGYKALYRHLVYANNVNAIKCCQQHGFKQVGCIPNAGFLKNIGYVDGLQFYKDLTFHKDK